MAKNDRALGSVFLRSAPFSENLSVSAASNIPAPASQLDSAPGSSVSTMATPSGGCTANPIALTSPLAVFTTRNGDRGNCEEQDRGGDKASHEVSLGGRGRFSVSLRAPA